LIKKREDQIRIKTIFLAKMKSTKKPIFSI